MTESERVEIAKIHGIVGKSELILNGTRPFRKPHHTTSSATLLGGGNYPRPGEITLADQGVLFLDELAEFPKNVLEALREPLEEGSITITRNRHTITFPARFLLIAAMNPCPCGYHGDPTHACRCSRTQINHYHKRISGPLLDRIDMCVHVGRQSFEQMETAPEPSTKFSAMQIRISEARQRQLTRGALNAGLTISQIRTYCYLNTNARQLLKNASNRYELSSRSIHRILKVSRTIADLAHSEPIEVQHVAEAIQYRINQLYE